jgi:hypothetical protein
MGDHDHGRLVALYCEETGRFQEADLYDMSPRKTFAGVSDPEVRRQLASGEIESDPLFAIVARKKVDAA